MESIVRGLVEAPAHGWNGLTSWEHWLVDGCWVRNGDPRLIGTPLVGTFRPILSVLLPYLAFVTVLGPRWMAKRKPFHLKRVLLGYNLAMCLINAGCFAYLVYHGRETWNRILDTRFPPYREPTDRDLSILAFNLFYGATKFLDLCDTVFFVLRKKQSQVTALHLYHHFSVPFFGWTVFRLHFLCNILTLFLVLNTFVHTVMYGYYGLAVLGPWVRPYLWWKRYLTLAQLGQFVLLSLHWVYFMVTQVGNPRFFQYNYVLQTTIYLVLFGRFYLQTYRAKRQDGDDEARRCEKQKSI